MIALPVFIASITAVVIGIFFLWRHALRQLVQAVTLSAAPAGMATAGKPHGVMRTQRCAVCGMYVAEKGVSRCGRASCPLLKTY